MRVAFITGPRKNDVSYVQDTVRLAIEKSVNLNPEDVLVCNDACGEIPGLPDGVRCRDRSPAYIEHEPNPFLRITKNYIRALRCVSEPGPSAACVCEDDLDFAKCWYSHALEFVKLLAAEGPFWAMTLIHYYERRDFGDGRAVGGRELLRWGDVNSFYGQQAMVYSPMTARQLSIEWSIALDTEDLRKGDPLLVDMGLKTMLKRLRVPLYAVHPNLVQHVGDVSGVIARDIPLRSANFWSGE